MKITLNCEECPPKLGLITVGTCVYNAILVVSLRVQELCENRGGRPGLSVLMSLMVSVDVKQR